MREHRDRERTEVERYRCGGSAHEPPCCLRGAPFAHIIHNIGIFSPARGIVPLLPLSACVATYFPSAATEKYGVSYRAAKGPMQDALKAVCQKRARCALPSSRPAARRPPLFESPVTTHLTESSGWCPQSSRPPELMGIARSAPVPGDLVVSLPAASDKSCFWVSYPEKYNKTALYKLHGAVLYYRYLTIGAVAVNSTAEPI